MCPQMSFSSSGRGISVTTLWYCDLRQQRGDLSHANGLFSETLAHLSEIPAHLSETLAHLSEALAHLPRLLQLSVPQSVENLDVSTQLSADLRHVMISASRQHAGSGSISPGDSGFRAGEDGLLTKPSNLALKDGQAGFEVIGRVRHGRDPTVG
jgi:hypothetical protein